jgi:hypothetical protein
MGPIGGSFELSSLDSTLTTAAATETNSISPGVSLAGSKHLLDIGPDEPADVLCIPVSSNTRHKFGCHYSRFSISVVSFGFL